MEARINSFDELIQFIEDHDLSSKEIAEIIHKVFLVFADEDLPRKVLIQQITDFWAKWKNNSEKPLFLDMDLDVIK